jgi:hypothetical protein
VRGVRRSHGRITRLGNPDTDPAYQPVTGGQASPPAPMVMPLAAVWLQPVSDQYATVAYSEYHPMWAPDGETIPAMAPGRWAQLRAAGRP